MAQEKHICSSKTFPPLLHNGQGDEGHEEEGGLCKACQAPCLLWQDRQDQRWSREICPCEEQERQGREQEGEPQGQEERLDCSRPEGTLSSEDQGLLPNQEGHTTLQEGQGALWQVSTAIEREASQ